MPGAPQVAPDGRSAIPRGRGTRSSRRGPPRGMRPHAFLIVAAGQRLYAPTLEELAEIAECAARADDPIELLRARTPRGWRLLSDEEFDRFLRLLAAQLD
jgi:hypothetical protein